MMMYKNRVTILLCVIAFYSNGQSYNNLWLMGYGSGGNYGFGGTDLKFTSSTMDTSYHFREMNFRETNAVITDKNGKLLFYSNGEYVANALDDTMKNGKGLNPGWYVNGVTPWGLSIWQGNLVIPFPADSNRYYLFHNTAIYNTNFGFISAVQLMYSTINMKQDSGRGRVMLKNEIIVDDSLGGTISGVKHGNGRDWWVVCFKSNSNQIFTLLITPQGIQGPFTQIFGDSIYGANGQCVFSPDGNRFARHNRAWPHHDLSIYDFDRCTGLFSNPINIQMTDSNYLTAGVAFSSNGKYLYASSNFNLYQFYLDTNDVSSTQTLVDVWDGFYSPAPPFACKFYLAALAPNNKIYITSSSSTKHLHVINNPDTVAAYCDFQQHAIELPTRNAWTMPNLPNYHLGPKYGSVCDSLSTDLTPNPSPFGEGNSLRINPNPSAGNFYVNYTLPPNTNGVLHIYDLVGNEVMQKNVYWYFGYLQIDATTLQNGMYIASLEIGGRHWAGGKVVIFK